MSFDHTKEEEINLMLLRESLWKVEDRLNTLMEGQADHEAELVRVKRILTLLGQRVDSLEARKHSYKTN